MEYTVIKAFRDVVHQVSYMPGDEYPRRGKATTRERIAGLLSDGNAQKTPLIKAVETVQEEPKQAKRGRKPKKQVPDDAE